MNVHMRSVLLAVVFAVVTAPAAAEDGPDPAELTEDLDLTMRLMPQDAQRPDIITKTITLPPAALRNRQDDGDAGDDAEDRGQDGRDIADEARERGRDFGQDMAERARENREDATRGGPPEDIPGPPDDLPGGPPGKPSD